MLFSDMQSCAKKANVMNTGQGNKEQVSQDLKDGFLIYILTTRLLMLTTIQQFNNSTTCYGGGGGGGMKVLCPRWRRSLASVEPINLLAGHIG
jgi:hypothetical protein